MYVADVYELEELQYLLSEAEDWLAQEPDNEQAAWDIEDIKERMEELGG